MKKVLLFFGFSVVLTAVAEKADNSPSNFAPGSVPKWALSDPANTGATIVPSEDGLTATVSVPATATNSGAVIVTVTGEGDPEAGLDTITGSVEVACTPVEATQVVITAGAMVANS